MDPISLVSSSINLINTILEISSQVQANLKSSQNISQRCQIILPSLISLQSQNNIPSNYSQPLKSLENLLEEIEEFLKQFKKPTNSNFDLISWYENLVKKRESHLKSFQDLNDRITQSIHDLNLGLLVNVNVNREKDCEDIREDFEDISQQLISLIKEINSNDCQKQNEIQQLQIQCNEMRGNCEDLKNEIKELQNKLNFITNHLTNQNSFSNNNNNNNNTTTNNSNDKTANDNEESNNYNVRLNPDLFISQSEQNRDELIKLLIDNSVLIMTGSGVSSSLTSKQRINVFTWNGLLDSLKKLLLGIWADGQDNHFFANWDALDAFEKSQYLKEYASFYGVNDFRKYVLPLLGGIHPDNEPDIGNETSITTVLSALRAPIATTNYDILSEIKLKRIPNNMQPDQNLDDILENFNDYIFHISGIFYDARDIILEENVDTWESFRLKIESYFPQKSILFVGCQDTALDFHFTSYYELYPDLKHYILLTREEFYNLRNDEKIHDLFARYLQRGSLNVIIYGDEYHELVPFLWDLVAGMGIMTFPDSYSFHGDVYFNCTEQRVRYVFDGQQWNAIRTSL